MDRRTGMGEMRHCFIVELMLSTEGLNPVTVDFAVCIEPFRC